MSIINIGLLLIAGLDLGMALVIWQINKKNKINISLALTLFLIGTWSLGVGMFKEAQELQTAWFWMHFLNTSGSLMVLAFFLFSVYFPYQQIKLELRHKLIIFISLILLLIIVYTPRLWVSEVILSTHNNDYINNRIGNSLFAFIFYFFLVFSYVNLFKKYKSSEGFAKIQLKYIMVGSLIIAIFGSFFGIIMQLATTKSGPEQIAPYFSLFFVLDLIYFGFFYKRN